jgi:hypothetical protein
MAQFPILKTGAVAQYPLVWTRSFRTDIVAFLDGSEQRFRNSSSVLHAWEIDLAKLDELELASVEQFFLGNQGQANLFVFTDPGSGANYPNCSIDGADLILESTAPLSGRTTVVVRENRT